MLLGLDLGTTNVKALAVAPDGRIAARGSAPVPTYHVEGGGVEQDIEEIWRAALDAVRQAGASTDLTAVRAVGVSSQGGALQMLDGRDRPAGRVISWLDGRFARQGAALTRQLGSDWCQEHIGHGAVSLVAGQLLRLREQTPALVEPPARVGFVGDVIVGRLCGRRAHDRTSLSIAMLLNPTLGRADPELLRHLGIAEGQLPDLLPATQAAGGLADDAARATGLPAGVPVSPAVHDQYAAALGSGTVHAGDVMFGAGTAWVLLAVTPRGGGVLRPAVPGGYVCPHVVPGLVGQMLSMVNGGSAHEWAVKLLGLTGMAPRERDALMESVPAGSDGLRFRPLLAAGGRAGLPPATHGRLDGIRLSHMAAYVLRAVDEGLAMEFVRHLGLLRSGGVGVERLVMCGGAAKGSLTPQIVADAAGLPVACIREGAVSALGAAVLARALLEGEAELARLAEEMTPPARSVSPGADAPFYQDLFREYVGSLPDGRED